MIMSRKIALQKTVCLERVQNTHCFAKHMAKHHVDGKFPINYYLSVFYLHHIHLLLCAVEDYDPIGPPEYTGKMLHSIG